MTFITVNNAIVIHSFISLYFSVVALNKHFYLNYPALNETELWTDIGAGVQQIHNNVDLRCF